MKFLGILLLSFFLTTEINAACDTKEKKKKEKNKKHLKLWVIVDLY